MNRWLAGALVLIVILITAIYLLIPSRLAVTKIVLVNCNRDCADRVLQDTSGWKRWWPPAVARGFKMSASLHRGAVIGIDRNGSEIPSTLTIYPLGSPDSSYLQWQFTRNAGWNPLERIGQYRQAVQLKAELAVILDSLRNFLSKPENVYGIVITQASTNDSFLVETTRMVKGNPGTKDIYDVVKRLTSFAGRRGSVRTGYPMMNIDTRANDENLLRIAIPINKELEDSEDIVYRKLVKGNYLESDVRGGPAAVNEAFQHMKDYIADNKRMVMAIPFFSLITDRTSEPDSANWITRIYYPIY